MLFHLFRRFCGKRRGGRTPKLSGKYVQPQPLPSPPNFLNRCLHPPRSVLKVLSLFALPHFLSYRLRKSNNFPRATCLNIFYVNFSYSHFLFNLHVPLTLSPYRVFLPSIPFWPHTPHCLSTFRRLRGVLL